MMIVNFWLFFNHGFQNRYFHMKNALNIINFKIGDVFAKLQNNSGL
jgi:hypothetical protein